MQRSTWLKVGLVALLLVGVPWLFLGTVQDTIAEPYVIDDASLSGWTLALAETRRPSHALIELRPPGELCLIYFNRFFTEPWSR